MMRLGILTDEISLNIREAVSLGLKWGIRDFEFRCSESGRVPLVSKSDIELLLKLKGDYQLNITALSPGIFKAPLSDKSAIQKDLADILPATIELAHKFDTPLIIAFGFVRSGAPKDAEFDEAVRVYRKASELAEHEGVTLAVENEPGFVADTGEGTARLLRAIDSKAVRSNWDPANALGAEPYPYPVGYNSIKPWVVNVHMKDAEKDSTIACVPIGAGKIDWEGQLRALVEDGRLQHVTIETHCLPLIENSKQNVAVVTRMLETIYEEIPKGNRRR